MFWSAFFIKGFLSINKVSFGTIGCIDCLKNAYFDFAVIKGFVFFLEGGAELLISIKLFGFF